MQGTLSNKGTVKKPIKTYCTANQQVIALAKIILFNLLTGDHTYTLQKYITYRNIKYYFLVIGVLKISPFILLVEVHDTYKGKQTQPMN